MIGIGNIVSTLFFAESKPDMDLLIEQFVRVFEQSEDKRASSTLVNWFQQLAVHGYVKPEEYAALAEVYRSTEEVTGMLQSAFKSQQDRWYQQGIEKGREEGIEKGREDALRRTALAMFARGIDPVLIADVTGLSADELNALLTSLPPEDETP